MKWLLFFGKKYATPLLSALLVAGVIGIWLHGYQTGQQRANAEVLAELELARSEQARLTDELELAQAEQRVVYRDRVRVVEREADPSGCADVRVPDRVRDALGGSSD